MPVAVCVCVLLPAEPAEQPVCLPVCLSRGRTAARLRRVCAPANTSGRGCSKCRALPNRVVTLRCEPLTTMISVALCLPAANG